MDIRLVRLDELSKITNIVSVAHYNHLHHWRHLVAQNLGKVIICVKGDEIRGIIGAEKGTNGMTGVPEIRLTMHWKDKSLRGMGDPTKRMIKLLKSQRGYENLAIVISPYLDVKLLIGAVGVQDGLES